MRILNQNIAFSANGRTLVQSNGAIDLIVIVTQRNDREPPEAGCRGTSCTGATQVINSQYGYLGAIDVTHPWTSLLLGSGSYCS